jgi:hypothetical protein
VNGGEPRTLQNLNSPRSTGNPHWPDLNLLTRRFGETVPSPEARLAGRDVVLEITSGHMAFGEELVMRVVRTAHRAADNALIAVNHAILTASHRHDINFLESLQEDDIIRLTHSVANRRGTNIDWAQVDQAIPAHFLLISSGRRQPLPEEPGVLEPSYPDITPNPDTRNPLPRLPSQNIKRARTAVGVRSDGTMVWVVVSGGADTGMTMPEFQDYLMSLNLRYAWNFDGGGSSAMFIGETRVTYSNGPESNVQRAVANGLVLVNRQPPNLPFVDMHPGQWFADYVMFAYDNGLMSGTHESPMIFSPDRMLTRNTFVLALYRRAGSPDVSELDNPFSDVSEGRWYTDAVIWAAHNGIVQGVRRDRFAPRANITREQIAVMMVRYANFTGETLPAVYPAHRFADSEDTSAWAMEAATAVQRAGIITGKPGNLYDPQGNVTRAETAAILFRFAESIR